MSSTISGSSRVSRRGALFVACLLVSGVGGVAVAGTPSPLLLAPAVDADPARLVIDGSVTRVAVAARAGEVLSLPGASVRAVPARTRIGTSLPMSVTVTRTVELDRLRLRVGDLSLPVMGASGQRHLADTHVVLSADDAEQASTASRIELPGLSARLPVDVPAGSHATLEFIDGGMAERCMSCPLDLAPLDQDEAAKAATALAERRRLHADDILLADWRSTTARSGGVRLLLVWQLRSDARHLAVESYLSGGSAPTGERLTVAGGWRVAQPHADALGSTGLVVDWQRTSGGWASFAVERAADSTSAAPLTVTSELPAASVIGGTASFLRVAPGRGALLADQIGPAALAALPAQAAAVVLTTREDATQSLAWGQSVNLAMTKHHDCTYDPNRAGGWTSTAPDLLVDCYQYQGVTFSDGHDSYWSEEHTKPHTQAGYVVGWTATSRCWIYSYRPDSNFSHHIDRCRFHNSEHNDESMSAQRQNFFNCVPDWTTCFRESDQVPNDGWRTYDYITCCDFAIPPIGFSPAEYSSVWWTSIRAHVNDTARGWNSVACTYVNIQPMRSSGEGGYCNYHDGISP